MDFKQNVMISTHIEMFQNNPNEAIVNTAKSFALWHWEAEGGPSCAFK